MFYAINPHNRCEGYVHATTGRRIAAKRTTTGGSRLGAVLFGGTATVGGSVAGRQQPGLASEVESYGHYAWFPFGPDSWGRSKSPFDSRDGDSRWMAQPEDDGGVRCLVANVGTEPPNRNAGFGLHLGRLGKLDAVTIDARTVQTQRTTSLAMLFVGLYVDKNDDGEFFAWEAEGDGDADSWIGIGGDEEGITPFGASGESIIDDDTTFWLC